jgi:hypothetical protein
MPEKLPLQNLEISKAKEQEKPRYIKSEEVKENKRNIMGWLSGIRDAYRESIVRLFGEEEKVTLSNKEKKAVEKTRKELIKKMDAEQARIEKLATREGVNFSKCQMGEIVKALKEGNPVEYEALSPYLADYNTATGEIWQDKLLKADAIGLAVSAVLRKLFDSANARLISLYDEYNSGLPDSTDLLGAPKSEGPQLKYLDQTKVKFKNSLKELLASNGSIRESDKEGENYLFVSESSKVTDAERELVPRLKEYFKAHPEHGRIKENGNEIIFVNNEAENPKYREIQLRTPNGRWRCEALDASSYLKPENLEITHLVILPNEFKEQQDKVWEILRVLGIKPTNYHNIFYDQEKPPETVARVIQEEIEKYM